MKAMWVKFKTMIGLVLIKIGINPPAILQPERETPKELLKPFLEKLDHQPLKNKSNI